MKGKELLTFLREIEDTEPDLLEKEVKILSHENTEDVTFLYNFYIKRETLNEDFEFVDIDPELVLVSTYNS